MRRSGFQKVAPSCAILTGIAVLLPPALAQGVQGFPSGPVRLVVAGGSGAQIDALARLMGPRMSESFGQPVVIVNVPGAAGILAANKVARAEPDGRSLLLADSGFAVGAALHSKLPYDPRKDFAGVSQVGIPTTVLAVAPELGVRSVQELITLARSRPGKLIFGSPGPGSGPHLLNERLRLGAGISVVNVQFSAGRQQTLLEVATGRIHYCFAPLGSTLPFVRDGKLVPLAVTTAQRSPVLPDVPMLGETLPGFAKPLGSFGLLAPARTPSAILGRISTEVARIFALREVAERMSGDGLMLAPTTPEEYDRILSSQIAGFADLIRVAGIPTR
jgi:tripartite-type tricarboxylate transporter receptor subunit TctC